MLKKSTIDCLTWSLSTEIPSTEKSRNVSLVNLKGPLIYDVMLLRKSLCSLFPCGRAAMTTKAGAFFGCFGNHSTQTLISDAILVGYSSED